MVSLWIQKPLEFSAFPTVLLITTVLRLALGVATTRLILAHGGDGVYAAGHIIQGFSRFVMSGDFVIGIVVFLILVTVNFVVITKGATRIAEVGARFTLDAIPGKQMAIDADLNAGLIDDKEAHRRRRELEEESSFFGSMDGASKFVRGEAIASLVIIAVNIFGGIIIGTTRHGMPLATSADVFTRLTVGDGLVSQIPALVVSLAAGLLVSKGGNTGPAERAVLGQLGSYPRALFVAAALMFIMGLMPGLPSCPSAFSAPSLPAPPTRFRAASRPRAGPGRQGPRRRGEGQGDRANSVKEALKTEEIEICVGKQLARQVLRSPVELANRVAKMRRKFALQYGFVVPDIKVSESLSAPPKSYEVRIHGAIVASHEMRIGELLVVTGDGDQPDVPGEEVREPAFGMRALWVPEAYEAEVQPRGLHAHRQPVGHADPSQRDHPQQPAGSCCPTRTRAPCSTGSIPNTSACSRRSAPRRSPIPASRRFSSCCWPSASRSATFTSSSRRSRKWCRMRAAPEQIAEHVRMRIAQQICGDLAEGGVLNVLRLGNRWDLAFHQSLKRDAKGEVIEFDIDPRLVEEFATEASEAIRKRMGENRRFVLVAAPDARPYLRMIIERMFPSLPVLSHVEIARGVEINALGTIS